MSVRLLFDNYKLRLVELDDLEAYHRLIEDNRKRLEDFFAGTVAQTTTLEDSRAHLTEVIRKNARKEFYSFVLTDDASDRLIASVQVKSLDWNVPKAELGYYIDAAYEGKGLVSRAVAVIVKYCFEQLQLNKLYIRAHESNIASRKIAEHNGFRLEGVLRQDYKTTRGELVDLMYYGLLREEKIFDPLA